MLLRITRVGFGSTRDELLRRFRDRVLRRTAAGRRMIRMYYRTAPALCRRFKGAGELIGAMRLRIEPALWIAKAALAIQEKKERGVTTGGVLIFILLAIQAS